MIKFIDKGDITEYAGYEPEPTEWLAIGQDRINAFADCTEDHQFIHVDPEVAKNSPFGTTIAHGFLTLSMLSYFGEQYSVIIEGMYMGVNYGFDKVRFLAPVKVDSRIRAKPVIMEVTQKGEGKFLVRTQITVEIEGEETPALVAQWLTMQMVA